MSYYLPSYIQKRLLRFALSYLDFVETDDLDFDQFGVTIGRRNVIELKDVGFRIKVR
jgi:autophagy-related protein 2